MFFSSVNGAKCFLNQFISDANNCKIAAIGPATSSFIKSHGFEVKFEGAGTDLERVAQGFKVKLGNERVIFPMGKKSRRTIAHQFPENQREVVECYDTVLEGKELQEECDVMVFTSPSNVEGFHLSNKVLEHAKVLAIGNTTKNELHHYGIDSEISWAHSELALAEKVCAILC